MKKLKKISTLLVLCCTMAVAAVAQNAAEVMNNQSVVDMIKAGFSKELIISKIETSECKFNTSTQALIDLKKQKVPEDVINAIINRSSSNKNEPRQTSNKASLADASPVNLEILNLIHVWNSLTNGKSPLERVSAQMRTRAKALGYGGVNVVFEVPGEKSPVRLNDSLPVFIVNTGGAPPDGFVLYKLTVKKRYRQAVSANYSTISGMKGSQGVYSVNIRSLKNGLFELSPAAPLAKGEYFFALKSSNNAMTTSNAEVFAFGID